MLNNSMHDSFLRPPSQNKENALKRSNYQASKLSIDSDSSFTRKLSRSNSTSVLVVKALQQKISDMSKQQAAAIKEKDAVIAQLQSVESQLQRQYAHIEEEHRGLIPILTKYQDDIKAMKSHKETQLKEMQQNYDQSLQVATKKLTQENQHLQDKLNKLQEENIYLEEQVHTSTQELKKERQQALRMKQEYLQKLDENDQQFEQQIEHYSKLNSQLQQQLQKYIHSEEKQKQMVKEQFSRERDELLEKFMLLQQENDTLKAEHEQQIRAMEKEIQSCFHDCKFKSTQLATENESLKGSLQRMERERYETLAAKDQENRSLVQRLESVAEEVARLSDMLKLEQSKNVRLEMHLQSIVGEMQQSKRETSTYRDSSATPKKLDTSQNLSTYRQQSDYKGLLQAIVETEKRACQLNETYQAMLQQVGKGNQQGSKTELYQIVERIKQTNSELCELKAKEFSMFT